MGGDLAHAGGAQVIRVLPDVAQVHDADLSAGAEHADELIDRAAALVASTDVVDDEIGDDGIEGCIGERQFADVAFADIDAIGDTFGGGVGERGGGAVLTLIALRPNVDADGATGGDTAGGADQEKAVAAPGVEDRG